MASQPKSVKSAVKTAPATPFEAFNVSVAGVEMPAVFRDLAEKSISQARDAYSKMKAAAEEATDLVAAKANSDASFEFAMKLFGAKTFAEVIELQTSFARQQFDTYGAQFKEIQDLTQKYVTEATKPVTAQVEKSFQDLKAA
jgi:phasin family protein